jgi:hypothetical protein
MDIRMTFIGIGKQIPSILRMREGTWQPARRETGRMDATDVGEFCIHQMKG